MIAKILSVALTTIFLLGCVGFVKSNVAEFHRLSENLTPTTYTFIPLEGQEDDVEYYTYQDLIRQQLSKHQYREVIPQETPTVIIAFIYGNYGTYSGITTYSPTYGIIGSSKVSTTEYNLALWLYVVDAKSVGGEKINFLYEGSVISVRKSSQLSEVMPKMIEVLFKKFPGKSDSTRTEIKATK